MFVEHYIEVQTEMKTWIVAMQAWRLVEAEEKGDAAVLVMVVAAVAQILESTYYTQGFQQDSNAMVSDWEAACQESEGGLED